MCCYPYFIQFINADLKNDNAKETTNISEV